MSSSNVRDYYTALFGKVYLTIFQSKRRRLVVKTEVIMYIQNEKITQKYFKYTIFTYIYIFVIKLKHNMNMNMNMNSIDR